MLYRLRGPLGQIFRFEILSYKNKNDLTWHPLTVRADVHFVKSPVHELDDCDVF